MRNDLKPFKKENVCRDLVKIVYDKHKHVILALLKREAHKINSNMCEPYSLKHSIFGW